MWKKTITDEKIETNLVLKSDLSWDIIHKKLKEMALKHLPILHVLFVLGARKLHLKDSGKFLKDPKEM